MALKKAQDLLAGLQARQYNTFESTTILRSTITHAEMKNNSSRVECSTPVLQEFTNSAGLLHTGALTTIIDGLTTLTVWVADRQPRVTASVALSVSVHGTVSLGEVLRVVGTCDKVGKKIAFSSAEVFAAIFAAA